MKKIRERKKAKKSRSVTDRLKDATMELDKLFELFLNYYLGVHFFNDARGAYNERIKILSMLHEKKDIISFSDVIKYIQGCRNLSRRKIICMMDKRIKRVNILTGLLLKEHQK